MKVCFLLQREKKLPKLTWHYVTKWFLTKPSNQWCNPWLKTAEEFTHICKIVLILSNLRFCQQIYVQAQTRTIQTHSEMTFLKVKSYLNKNINLIRILSWDNLLESKAALLHIQYSSGFIIWYTWDDRTGHVEKTTKNK